MKLLLLTVFSGAIINNIVLVQQVGVCPLMHGSGSLNRLFRLGLVMTAVMMIGVMAGGVLNAWFLGPWRLGPMTILIDALVILLISRLASWAAVRLGWFPPSLGKIEEMMLSAQCVALAVILLSAGYGPGLSGLAFGGGSGLGWTMVAVGFEPVRRRLDEAPIPSSMRGLPIYLVAIGLLALVGMGLTGATVIE